MNKKSKQTIFLLDVGNSSVKWAMSVSGELFNMSQTRYHVDVMPTFFIDSWKSIEKPHRVVASCVASEQVWQSLEKTCKQLWNVNAERIYSIKQGFNLDNAYSQPSDLGSDRWCAMVGADQSIHADFILIDCGSAITIDIVEKSDQVPGQELAQYFAQHKGGYILPGFEMMKQSLAVNTAKVKIDSIPAKNQRIRPGITTTECVQAGINLAVVKSVEAVIQRQSKKFQCLLTGGDAHLIADLLSVKCTVMPNLVLQGLTYMAEDGEYTNPDENKNYQE